MTSLIELKRFPCQIFHSGDAVPRYSLHRLDASNDYGKKKEKEAEYSAAIKEYAKIQHAIRQTYAQAL